MRQEGYYWVRYDGNPDYIVGFSYLCGMGRMVWTIMNRDQHLEDWDLDEIDERRIERHESRQDKP